MGSGDMRYGRCGACGSDEVYQGEVAGQIGIRRSGKGLGKQTAFHAYFCAWCGHMQWHLALDEKRRSWIRKLDRVPPSNPWQQQ
ncbi:hypothetical protein [Streptomyces winkii]|uniref:hypothetical protein n=1 Tax=Streptomyces winkii TaxID=3051178 RepID=UPI0028D4B86C|nr:hypothetical protein [Streptomyces sp. DSM 40971]